MEKHKLIQEIEKWKFKDKYLYYVLLGIKGLKTGINYGSSFLIPFINFAAASGNAIGAVGGIGLLFSRDSINSSISLVETRLELKYRSSSEQYTVEKYLDILDKSRGVVTEENEIECINNGVIEKVKEERVLKTPETSSKLQKYFRSLHARRERLPVMYMGLAASAITLAGTIGVVASTGGNIALTSATLLAGAAAGVGTTIYTNMKREKIMKEYIKLESKEKLDRNEFFNKEPINNEDKEFAIKRNLKSNLASFNSMSRMRTIYSNAELLNSFVLAASLATIAFGQVSGISDLTPTSILSLTTMVYFYSDVIGKITQNINNVKDIIEINQDYNQGLELANDIAKQIETKKDQLKTVTKDFDALQIKDFKGKFYSKVSVEDEIYKEHVINIPKMEIKKGETVLLSGESGSGKTTLFRMIKDGDFNNTGSITIDNDEKIDYLGQSALLYTPSINLCDNENVLYEITCGNGLETLPREKMEKLREICTGLKLNDIDQSSIIFKKDILKTLSEKTYSEFSVGQQQRLVLAKILYLLGDEQQMVIFDEPTANLDSDTANSVFNFINDFCNRDKPRAILISSHQVNIASKYADRRYHLENGIVSEKELEFSEMENSRTGYPIEMNLNKSNDRAERIGIEYYI